MKSFIINLLIITLATSPVTLMTTAEANAAKEAGSALGKIWRGARAGRQKSAEYIQNSFSTSCQTAYGMCFSAPKQKGASCSCYNGYTGRYDFGTMR